VKKNDLHHFFQSLSTATYTPRTSSPHMRSISRCEHAKNKMRRAASTTAI
jgi:hypothetical protein